MEGTVPECREPWNLGSCMRRHYAPFCSMSSTFGHHDAASACMTCIGSDTHGRSIQRGSIAALPQPYKFGRVLATVGWIRIQTMSIGHGTQRSPVSVKRRDLARLDSLQRIWFGCASIWRERQYLPQPPPAIQCEVMNQSSRPDATALHRAGAGGSEPRRATMTSRTTYPEAVEQMKKVRQALEL